MDYEVVPPDIEPWLHPGVQELNCGRQIIITEEWGINSGKLSAEQTVDQLPFVISWTNVIVMMSNMNRIDILYINGFARKT